MTEPVERVADSPSKVSAGVTVYDGSRRMATAKRTIYRAESVEVPVTCCGAYSRDVCRCLAGEP